MSLIPRTIDKKQVWFHYEANKTVKVSQADWTQYLTKPTRFP